MSVLYPVVLAVAAVVTGAAVAAYVALARRRAAALSATGLGTVDPSRRAAARRHLPYALMLAALPVLLVGLARPQATIELPRVAGTVMLVFDVSNSMAADDLQPSRLAAAQAAATSFVQEQPGTIDIGVVAFGDQALATQAPTGDHAAALAAIKRLNGSGGTSLGQAILTSLSAITGKPVSLPGSAAAPGGGQAGATGPDGAAGADGATGQDGTSGEDGGGQDTDLGYWSSATIVIFSDGGDNTGPDATAAAELAAGAGVHIQTVGVGTAAGATVEVDGYQLTTALDEQLLTTIAQTTGGAYQRAGDTAALTAATGAIDLRLTSREEPVELTGPFAAGALVLLAAGALLAIRWHGRIV